MKTKVIFSAFLVCLLLIILSSACKKKKKISCDGTQSTYNSNIKSIIDANCVSCHPPYSSYAGIKSILDNGSFASEVLDKQSMPKKKTLSSGELTLIQCWKDQGFPEK
jgi:hypothetical protein